MKTIEQKEKEVAALLTQHKKVGVAFSGGTDSTLLCYLAQKYLGNNALAITVATPYVPKWEINEAKSFAKQIGIKHVIIELDIPEHIKSNPANRCYLCKKELFNKIISVAENYGCDAIIDGSNFDDTSDYRPGMKALKELQVISPLLLVEITKSEVRQLSRSYSLPTSDKPAYACLLTRLEFDRTIDINQLSNIEKAEVYLHNLGYKAVRVRIHSNIARIELSNEEIKPFILKEDIRQISSDIKQIGFKYVTIDLEGYSTGNMNEQILSPKK